MTNSSLPIAVVAESLDVLPDPVILIDRRASVVLANRAARSSFPSIVVGGPVAFALRMPEAVTAIDRALAGERGISIEFTARGRSERHFAMRISALDAREGERSAPVAVIALRDLTEARRLDTMRVDFVANASHELRTPLASLLGFIETLQGSAKDDPAARARFLDVMLSQARRMARLVDDLLSLSRVEMNEHRSPSGTVDIGAVARQTADLLAGLAAENGVEIRCSVAEHADLRVSGEPDDLLRVAENLVGNAVRYGASGKIIEIEVERREGISGDEVTLAVRDHGPGIPAEHIPRLTERFYRAAAGDGIGKGGTGLGLAIVKHVLNRHRARLAIESRLGEGSVFRASFPALRP